MIDKVLFILQLAINLAGAAIKNNPTELETSLLDLVRAGHDAYSVQTGKPIDPSLLKPYEPL